MFSAHKPISTVTARLGNCTPSPYGEKHLQSFGVWVPCLRHPPPESHTYVRDYLPRHIIPNFSQFGFRSDSGASENAVYAYNNMSREGRVWPFKKTKTSWSLQQAPGSGYLVGVAQSSCLFGVANKKKPEYFSRPGRWRSPNTNEWPTPPSCIGSSDRSAPARGMSILAVNASFTSVCRPAGSCMSVVRSKIVVCAAGGSTPTSFSCGVGIVGLFERTGSIFSFLSFRFFPFFSFFRR